MSRDEQQICLHCRHWKFFGKPQNEDLWRVQPGECWRRAPITNDLNEALSPPRRGGDWCGEFEHHDDRVTRLLSTRYGKEPEGEAA